MMCVYIISNIIIKVDDEEGLFIVFGSLEIALARKFPDVISTNHYCHHTVDKI